MSMKPLPAIRFYLNPALKPIRLSLFFLYILLIVSASNAYTADVILQWDTDQSGTAAGYKVYCGYSSNQYSVVQDAGNQMTCTFTNLGEGQTYYFSATSYDANGKESIPSNEVSYIVPIVDTDRDGLLDVDEINSYGTDPTNPDTDFDGLSDFEEVFVYKTSPTNDDTDADFLKDGYEVEYWGYSWNVDEDGDGFINILDADADGDGYTDGEEIQAGTDPADPSDPAPASAQYMVSLEAENGYLRAPMQSALHPQASGSLYIQVPTGLSTQQSMAGYARYTFAAPSSGDYAVWGRVLAPSKRSNSFYYSVDGSLDQTWNVPVKTAWTWNLLKVHRFQAGNHSLDIIGREAGTMLDMIIITNDLDVTPDGIF